MTISTAFCTSAKVDLFNARHNFGSHTFKLALYVDAASLGASTTAYSSTNEAAVSGGTGYTAGGGALSVVAPTTSGGKAIVDANDLVFTLSGTGAILEAAGCLIYNDSVTSPVADPAISTHSFAGTQQASGDGATFVLTFPAPDATNALWRLA